MDDATVIHAGYLKKSPPERRLWRTWHERYFVLKSNKTLTYYPNEKDTRPVKDPVDLSNCLSIEANLRHNNKKFKYVFSINMKSRVYYLVADSQQDMDTWVKVLCRECGFEKQDRKASPDFPKQANSPLQNVHPSPLTPQPPPICPLSQSMPMLNKPRTISDPPDSAEIIKRAEEQYKTATLERRRSTGVPSREHLTLPLHGPDLTRVPEYYDPVPPLKPSYSSNNLISPPRPPKSKGFNDIVDGGYAYLAQPSPRSPVDNYDIIQPRRPESSASSDYDIVPKPRPVSSEVHDIVPPHSANGANYDVVPTPRPVSRNDPSELYDYVPKHDPEEMYDSVPRRPVSSEDETYVHPRQAYATVPPPRPSKSIDTSECYDILPPPVPNNDIYDIPPTFSERNQEFNPAPPPRPPKPSGNVQAQDTYDVVPRPQNLAPVTENRDSGLYPDDIYDVPPKLSTPDQEEDNIYDIPPKQDDDGIYDTLPRRAENDDLYDIPPTQAAVSPPTVNRSCKPPPVNRNNKPDNHDYTNLAPLVNRKNKPPVYNHDHGDHSYENLLPSTQRGLFSKSQSLPESFNVPNMPLRDQQHKEYFDMQPYRSDETRCYSFSKDQVHRMSDKDSYEEMEPVRTCNRESGVHSNSSSEDGDEECYMTMTSPDQSLKSSQRSASLQYCEVQIVESQSKCHFPVSKRSGDSHYTTINEESTKALLETSRHHDPSHKK